MTEDDYFAAFFGAEERTEPSRRRSGGTERLRASYASTSAPWERIGEDSSEVPDLPPFDPPEDDFSRRAAAAKPACLSVSDVSRKLSSAVRGVFSDIWVKGEIANFTRARSGHCYFTIKDESSSLSAVFFSGYAASLGFSPENGDQVEIRCSPDFYAPRGQLQLKVFEMRRAGLGALYAAFLKLKAKLEAEGLFDPAAKRPVPAVPRRIGVVSSLQAAGVRDALRTLKRRAPYAEIVIYSASVQGRRAPQEIVRMLEAAALRAECDVLLLIRGGGSFEDLQCFNDEALARAIRRSPIPVIAGIGHESDVTIADLVADLRAATPTAAAELAASDAGVLSERVRNLLFTARRSLLKKLDFERQRTDYAEAALPDPARLAGHGRALLEAKEARARAALKSAFDASGKSLRGLENRLLAARRGNFGGGFARASNLESRVKALFSDGLAAKRKRTEELSEKLSALAPDLPALRGEADALSRRFREALLGSVRIREPELARLRERLIRRVPAVPELRRRDEALGERLVRAARQKTETEKRRTEALEARFESLEINRVLSRGYALLQKGERGELVRSVSSVAPGDELRVTLSDGAARVKVLEVTSGGAR